MIRRADTLLLVVVAAVLALPILGPFTPVGHDVLYYLIYGQQAAANLREGVWLPAWAPDLNYGFGGPALMFYPPLVHSGHALLLVAGIPLPRILGLSVFVAALLSGLTMRLWLRQRVEPRGAWIGAVLYMLAPYRVIDIYDRTALAEHWAFVYPPLLLWGIDSRRPAALRLPVIALSTAALLLTNLPLAVLLGLTIAAYAIARRNLAIPAAGACLGSAIAALSLVPQALASRFLRVELWFGVTSEFRPSAHTIFAAAGDHAAFNLRVSFVVVATALLAALATRRASPRFWVAVAVVAFVVTTPLAGALWDVTPVLSQLQFPWRAASILTLAAATLLAHVPSDRARIAVLFAGAAAAVPFYGKSIARQELLTAPAPPPMAARMFPDPGAVEEAGGGRSNAYHQHLVDMTFVPRTTDPALIDELRSPEPRLGQIAQRLAFPAGDPTARVDVMEWRRFERTVVIDMTRPGELIWHSLWFPTMEFIVDGRATPALVHDDGGLAMVRLAPGRHVVTWRWRPFPELQLGRWISFAGVVLLALSVTILAFREQTRAAP